MSPILCVAASLSPTTRKEIGLKAVVRNVPITHLADQHQGSRKFVYQQGEKAPPALDESFAPSQGDDDVLFHLPVTKNWLYQLILGLVLICHSSYRGVVELFRDLFDLPTALAPSTIGSKQRRRGHQKSIKPKIFQALRSVYTMRFFRQIALFS